MKKVKNEKIVNVFSKHHKYFLFLFMNHSRVNK